MTFELREGNILQEVRIPFEVREVKKLHHIGIAVRSLEEGIRFYREVLGFPLLKREVLKDRGIEIAFFPAGDTQLELIAPLDAQSSFNKSLEKRGEGLHHICFEVEDIERSAEELQGKGLLLVEWIRPGSDGGRVCFFHPRTCHGVLIELKEKEKNFLSPSGRGQR